MIKFIIGVFAIIAVISILTKPSETIAWLGDRGVEIKHAYQRVVND